MARGEPGRSRVLTANSHITSFPREESRNAQFAARRAVLLSRQARKDDTRRKILVGALILAKVEQGDFDERQLKRWLDKALTRADDRALFDLR